MSYTTSATNEPEDAFIRKRARLKDISSFITKGSTPTTYGFQWASAGVLFLRSECVADGGLDLRQSTFISEKAHAALRRSEIRPHDLLVTITGNVGRVIQFAGAERANLNQHIARVRITEADVDPRYVYYWLSQPSIRRHFEGITTGQAYPQLSLPQVRNTEVLLPSLPEQRAIAAALSDVDALLDALTRLIDKKRDLKRAGMQQLLTGHTRLPGFDEHWRESTVGDEFVVQLGKMLDVEKNAGVAKPYIGNSAVQWGQIDTSDLPTIRMSPNDIERYRLRKGDLLVCEGGDVGRAAIWDAPIEECYYQKALHRLRPRGAYDVRFMAALLELWSINGVFTGYVTRTSIAHLPQDQFIGMPLPVPSPAEQCRIANVLCDMDAEITALESSRDKTRALKQAMMQELLTGRTRLV